MVVRSPKGLSNCTMLILTAPSSEFQNLTELGFPGYPKCQIDVRRDKMSMDITLLPTDSLFRPNKDAK